MKISFTGKNAKKTHIWKRLERSEFFPFFLEIFTSNDSRIVKNHFQNTLKVPETLSERQGMCR